MGCLCHRRRPAAAPDDVDAPPGQRFITQHVRRRHGPPPPDDDSHHRVQRRRLLRRRNVGHAGAAAPGHFDTGSADFWVNGQLFDGTQSETYIPDRAFSVHYSDGGGVSGFRAFDTLTAGSAGSVTAPSVAFGEAEAMGNFACAAPRTACSASRSGPSRGSTRPRPSRCSRPTSTKRCLRSPSRRIRWRASSCWAASTSWS